MLDPLGGVYTVLHQFDGTTGRQPEGELLLGLDGRLGTRPVFLLLGGAFGLGAAMVHFFRAVAGQNERKAGPKP